MKPASLKGQRFRNAVTRKVFLLIREDDFHGFLEGIDRRITQVKLAILRSSDVWERVL
jgi:hypothetical protein